MRYLMILEVSQKQAYIFSSIRLRDNINNSNTICKVTDPQYFEEVAEGYFSRSGNLVYTGGGHTVLEFDSEESAKKFAFLLTERVRRDYSDLELFVKILRYDENKTPGDNLRILSEKLEEKKAMRRASFFRGSYGIEKMDTNSRRPREKREDRQLSVEKEIDGYKLPTKFDDIGNNKYHSSFIAVVHIDGNAMGKRVERLREKNKDKSWTEYKEILQKFSEDIDRDFKDSFEEMVKVIIKNTNEGLKGTFDLKEKNIPIRDVILAGDDVCFVTEGRIGIEAAKIFMDILSEKINKTDGKRYSACAGVALVHQKYPFYKAYELAEELCSNAKRFLVQYQDESPQISEKACAIDWHIDFGEIYGGLSDIRESYISNDGKHLELRPYFTLKPDELKDIDADREYTSFRDKILYLISEQESAAKGKIKEFREFLKLGEKESQRYLKENLMFNITPVTEEKLRQLIKSNIFFSGTGDDRQIFIKTRDGEYRSVCFDAIEAEDVFLPLE